MSTFYLLNTTRIGTQTRNAGDFIDDLIVDTGPLLAAGGLLWPSSDAIVAAAAVKCAKLRGQGQSGLVLDQMMSSAVNASQLATEGGAPGGIDGAHIIASTILDVAHAAGSKFGQLLAFLTGSGKLTNAGIDDASKLGLLRDTLTLAGQSTDASVDPVGGMLGAVPVHPGGDGSDDAIAIRAVEVAQAYKNRIVFGPGVYAPATPQFVPAGTHVELGGGATVLSSIASGTQMNAPFFGNQQLGIATVLAVTAHRGDRVLTLTDASYISLMPVTATGTAAPIINLKGTLTAPFPLRVECITPGALGVWTGRYQVDGRTWVTFTSAATVALGGIGTGAIMEIQPVAASVDNRWAANHRARVLFYPGGAGSLTKEVAAYSVWGITGVTLTLTRPLLREWRTGGDQIAVYPLTSANDLLIDSRGSVVVGTGDRAFEVVACERATLRNVYASGHFVDVTCGIDLANNLAFIDGAYVAGNSSGFSCYSMESSEDCVMERIYGHDSNSGIVVPGTDHGAIAHSAFWSCVNGWIVNTNDTDASEGCRNFLSFNTRTALCTYGCKIGDDARDTFVLGGSSDYGAFGLRQDASGVTGRVANYTAIVGWSSRENSQFGISHENGTSGNMGACVHLAENAGGALSLADSSVQSLVSSEFEDHGACGAAPLIHVASSSELRLATSRLVSLGGLGSPGLECTTGGVLLVDGLTAIGVAGNGPCLTNGGGALRARGLRTVGAWPAASYAAAGARTDLGDDLDVASCGVRAHALLAAGGMSVGVGGGTALSLGTGAFTIEMVVRLDEAMGAFGTGNGLGGLHDLSALGAAASFLAVNNDLVIYYNDGGAYPTITYSNFWTRRLGRYVMLTAVFTGAGHIILYADGMLVSDTAAVYDLSAAAHATIGLLDNFATGVTGASYQSLKVWTRALAAIEVEQRYGWNENGAAMRNGLVGEYLMNEGSGTSVADGSGTSRPLALANAMGWGATPWTSPALTGPGTHTARLWSDVAIIAISGAVGHEASAAEWRCQVQRLTGALTGHVPYYLPKLRGAIWTIDQRTTGGKNAIVGGYTGATVACGAGITRVTCDGTDFSAL